MKRIKVLAIFGTRPAAIKMAPVVLAMQDDPSFEVEVCVTGQHREMLNQMIDLFSLQVKYRLDMMKSNQGLAELLSRLIQELDSIVLQAKPDWILVQGDTTTCLAGALVGFYNQVKVGHVEAGLRTGDLLAPYPEEGNRALVSKVATLHFVPTQNARENLLSENISLKNIVVTGNTVIDSLLWVAKNLQWREQWKASFEPKLVQILQTGEKIILITGHRRENFGEAFLNICRAIRELAIKYPDWQFIYPVHLNPNVQKPVTSILSGIENIHLLVPLNYELFIYVMKQARFILTDSGGVQEEAPSLGKPILVLRDKTERPEGVRAGVAKLVGTRVEAIFHAVSALIDDDVIYEQMANAVNPYGDGQAASRILEALAGYES